ncbi:MAG: hypothetical protein K1X83_05065 [Oligoflexia bacterium]|nr:hypothetical protein [Oligoflexia bacterium]
MFILIVDADPDSRSRLKTVLAAVENRPRIRQCSSVQQALAVAEDPGGFTHLFVNSSIGDEGITEIAAYLQSRAKSPAAKLIVCLNTNNQKSESVAAMYLGGIDGFISEPFSTVSMMQLMDTLAKQVMSADERKARMRSAAGFLIQSAIKHLDQAAVIVGNGAETGGYPMRTLRSISKTLQSLEHELPDTLINMLIDQFAAAPPPKDRGNGKKRQQKEKVLHPGVELRLIMKQRGIQLEKLLEKVHLAAEELSNILDGKAPVTAPIAEALARSIGRPPSYWLSAQKRFDQELDKQKKRDAKRSA